MIDIDKSIRWIKSIAEDDSHGYSQYHRYGPDYDCSSLVTAALIAGGADIPKTLTTYDMLSYLLKAGYVKTSDSSLKKGDIFLSINHHVIMCIDDSRIATATSDENGGKIGKIPGDQTGREIYIRKFYTPSYGWDYHLRYTGKEENTKGCCDVELKILKKGDKDNQVKTCQIILKALGFKGADNKVLALDGSFGKNTDSAVRAFQKKNSLECDGVVGPVTWSKLLKG